MRSRPLALVLVVSSSLPLMAASCFNLDPRPPPPTTGGIIAGTINVASSSGASAGDEERFRRARAEVAAANAAAAAEVASTGGITVNSRAIVDESALPVPLRTQSKMPREWRAGDVLVGFKKHTYDEASLAAAMPLVMRDAGYNDLDARVVRCTAALYCLVELSRGGRILDMEETEDAALALHKSIGVAPGLRTVALNMKKWGLKVPNDPLFALQWHYDAIGMQAAWEIEDGDPDLVMAVVDCGIKQNHQDLSARLARDPLNNTVVGADLISDSGIDNDEFGGRDTNPDDPGDGLFGAQGSSFHGTHIAGTMAAETNNGEGVAGMTWEGQILAVRVLGLGLSGFDGDIVDGVFWALGVEGVQGVPRNVAPARIINLSLGGPSDAQSQQFWDDVATEIFTDPDNLYNDPILVAAAGNTDEDASVITPANVAGMITVGAANITGLRTGYSNYGPAIDVMAPGGDSGTDLNSDGNPDQVLSTIDVSYDFREGTSMAAPHVSGLAALLVSTNPSLTQATVEQIIKQSANPAGRCSEGCGAGTLDAVNALLLAGGEIQPEPLLGTDVTQVDFPLGLTSRTFHVVNLGNAPFSFSTIIEGAQGELFTVSPSSGTVPAAIAGGRVTVTVSLARGAFEAGSANLRVETTDTDPVQQALVSLDFNDDPTRSPRQIKNVQVAAYSRADGGLQKVAETIATSEFGFQYEIVGLRAGSYEVYAVGDNNDDGSYASDIESFGAYPTADEPQPVVVGDNQRVDAIDFGISSRFINDIIGGVGAPCEGRNDCTFAPDADCVTNFEQGYCSRFCDDDGFCDTGHCSVNFFDCSDENGDPFECHLCLQQCSSDENCRFEEGYVCDRGECIPEALVVNP